MPGLRKRRASNSARMGIDERTTCSSEAGSSALGAEAVEHRDAERADEVAVRSAARELLLEVEPQSAAVLGSTSGSHAASRRPRLSGRSSTAPFYGSSWWPGRLTLLRCVPKR